MGTTKLLKPYIRKVLDINTEHITKEDNTVLADSKFNNCPIACDPVENGYYLYVGFFAQKPRDM